MKLLFSIIIGIISIAIIIGCEKTSKGPEYLQESVAIDIIETLSIELLGVVPDDKEITVSTNKGEPIVLEQEARAGEAFRNIAKRIMGENVPFMDLNNESQGLFGSIMKLFKRK